MKPARPRPENNTITRAATLSYRGALVASILLAQGLLFGPLTGRAADQEVPLVDVTAVDPRIRLEIRYATTDNFMKEQLYPRARCLLLREVAESLSRVQSELAEAGLGLKIYDGYRPLSVQKKMWERVPVEGYVANPAKGSNHNRGAAVDVTLVDAEGRELPMPSAYDEFTERAHRDYAGGTEEERHNRWILQEAMEKHGFKGLRSEWWHFDYKEAKSYPVLDLAFDAVPSEPTAP